MKTQKATGHVSILAAQDEILRVTYLKKLFLIFNFCLLLIFINAFLFDLELHFEFLLPLFFSLFLYFYLTTDTTNLVAGMFVWGLVIIAHSFSWHNAGIFDAAIISYPVILILASMLGGRLLSIPILIFMVSSLFFLAYSYEYGLIEHSHEDFNAWKRASNITIIILAFGILNHLIFSYTNNLISSLSGERKKIDTIKKESEKLLQHDPLTNLPNELLARKDLENIINEITTSGKLIGFISLVIDNIKSINASTSHAVGDQVKCILAERLLKLDTEGFHIYRSMGNEFNIIYLANDQEEISTLCTAVVDVVTYPIQIDVYDFELIPSIGISVYPFDGKSYNVLKQKSHTALYKIKQSEHERFKFFEFEMEQQVKRRFEMLKDLKTSIVNNELELHYQPKLDIVTNRVVGCEALLRWYRNGTELISPAEFIPLAEESGYIIEIGKWVLETACKDCEAWCSEIKMSIPVAVNLSPMQLKKGNLAPTVFKALKNAALDPTLLELEITESMIIDDIEFINLQLLPLTSIGITTSIDDFGTGYANLNYLSKLNASVLKIDMSFIREMLANKQNLQIVNVIINMSKILGMENTAEGVEDKETASLLTQMGCQYGQGYYWCKPLPKPDFLKYLKSHLEDQS